MNSEADWAAAAQQFQQGLSQSWTQALQSLHQLTPEGAAAPMPLSFSPQKLGELQQANVKEAAQLWNQGLQATPGSIEKRFSRCLGQQPHCRIHRRRLPVERPHDAGHG